LILPELKPKKLPMNHSLRALFAVVLLTLTGCQTYVPSNSVRTVATSGGLSRDQVVNAVIEAARAASLPAMTKMDKANGIIEFGSFELPEMGLTAQVRLVSDTSLEITVRRGSAFIARNAEAQADAFRDRIAERLSELQKPVAQ
jgi:hypothetical protein